MAKVDYPASAAQIVELVGGSDNITKVAHCVTRVRFTLKDFDIARNNTEAIKAVPGVIQVVDAGGQYQVVIGTTVEQMYDEVVAITGNASGEVAADDGDVPAEKLNPFQALLKVISGTLVPLLVGMTGCGIMASVATLLNVSGIAPEGTETYQFFYNIGQACMYFFPVLVGVSAAQYFKMDAFLGGVIGACMAYPVATNPELANTTIHLFGLVPIQYQAYTGTVFPAIAAVAFASYVYKFFRKHVPAMVSFFMVPFLTLLVVVPLAFLVIGPLMNLVSGLLSVAVLTVYHASPILCGAILNALWLPFIVPMGVHQAIVLTFVADMITNGSSAALGLLCGIMVVSGVLMGVWAKSKNAETKQLALSTAITNAFGISEPGLYGVVLQHKETIAALCLAGAISGIFPALFHTTVYSFGASGLFGFPMYLDPSGNPSSIIGYVVTNLVALAAGFLITYFWPGFDPDKK